MIDADTKWIIFLNDFIKTIEELQEATEMDKEFIEFYNKYKDDVNNLANARENLSKVIKAKWNKIKQLIQTEEGHIKNQEGYFYKDICSAEYWVEYDIKQINETILIDILISTTGCYIIIGIEECTPGEKEKLEKLLDKKKIVFGPCPTDPAFVSDFSTEDYFLLEKFELLESEEAIAEKFHELQNTICDA